MTNDIFSGTSALRASAYWHPVTRDQARRFRLTDLRPSLSRFAGEVADGSLWLEIELTRSWKAAYRIHVQGHRYVISEVRVLPVERSKPGEPEMPPGEWAGSLIGPLAVAPTGGLSADVLKKLRSRKVVRQVEQRIDALNQKYGDRAAKILLQDSLPTRRRRGGQEKRTRTFYVMFVKRYVEVESANRQNRGRSTRKQLATEYGVSEHTVVGWLRKCETMFGFFAKTRWGQRGRHLTPTGQKAIALLAARQRVQDVNRDTTEPVS